MFDHLSGDGYVAKLRRRGFEVIGTGGAGDFPSSVVLAKPGSAKVIKVGTFAFRDTWPLFAEWCLDNPGPFRPNVTALKWHGRGLNRFYVATMDRLFCPLSLYTGEDTEEPTAESMARLRANVGTARSTLTALGGWYRMLEAQGIHHAISPLEAPNPALARRLAKGFKREGMVRLAEFIKVLTATFPDFMLDVLPQNWMFTADGQLVLIDPFLRSHMVTTTAD